MLNEIICKTAKPLRYFLYFILSERDFPITYEFSIKNFEEIRLVKKQLPSHLKLTKLKPGSLIIYKNALCPEVFAKELCTN